MTEWKEPTTPKYLEAKASLAADLLPHFFLTVQWYQYHARQIYNSGMISYAILAAMVQDGFRYDAAQVEA